MPSFAAKVTRFGFSALTSLSPSVASRAAWALFCRTPSRRPKGGKAKSAFASGALLLSQAEKLTVGRGAEKVGVQRLLSPDCSAPRILVIHGWGSRAEYLAELAVGLREAGAEVVVVDLPGHGRSAGRRLDMLLAARAFARVEERFGPFDGAVGHSFGGAALMTASGGAFPGVAAFTADRMAVIGSPSEIEDVFDGFSRMIGLSPEVRRLMAAHAERVIGCGIKAPDGVPIARRLARPLLVVHAEDDKEVGAKHARRYQGVGDHIRHHWANGQGHRRIVSAPEVIAEVAAFLVREPNAARVDGPDRLRNVSSF